MRPKEIAEHYARSWLAPDIFIVTLDWLMSFKVMDQLPNLAKLGKIGRIARMARLLRFLKLSSVATSLKDRVNSEYALTLMSLVRLVLFICLINHYIASAWFWLSTDPHLPDTWSKHRFNSTGSPTMGYAYATSLHWSLTQFTPASMEVTPKNIYERVFNLFIIILAMVTFSSFVSSITSAMTHIRNINARKMEQDSAIRRYFHDHKISHELAGRVWHFIRQNRMASVRRTKESEVPALNLLPQRIRQELAKESCMPILVGHALFERYSRMESEVMVRLCSSAIREKSMLTGEELFAGGDVKEMFFVVSGAMEYLETQANGLDVRFTVPTGGWACEVALWAAHAEIDGPFLAAAGGSELMLIHSSEFQTVVKGQIESTALLASYAELFVREFNNASKEEELGNPLFNNPDMVYNLTQLALERRNPNIGKEVAVLQDVLQQRGNQSEISGPDVVECTDVQIKTNQ